IAACRRGTKHSEEAEPALAAHGLQGLQGALEAQGFLAAHGLHGFFAAHGLQGFFLTAHGLHVLATTTIPVRADVDAVFETAAGLVF
ncbi:MAG: hypothetical protein V7740_16040, partial [Pseudomonas marincola]